MDLNIFGVDIPQERKEQILAYLKGYGLKPSQKGYLYLAGLISLLADEPTLSCNDLMAKYSQIVFNDSDRRIWWSVYRACRYALRSSKSAGSFAPYGFIKCGVMSLKEVG